MSRTFNCGIGMVLVVAVEDVAETTRMLEEVGETVYQIGRVVSKSENDGKEVVVAGVETAWGK